MKEFVTAGRRSKNSVFDNAEPVTFKVDDDEFTAYPPTEGQMALMMAAQANNRETSDHVAGVIDFFDGLLDEETQKIFRERLMDRDDPFDFDLVQEIMESLIEEWSGRPTQSPRGSTPSRPTTGRKSTARQRSTV